MESRRVLYIARTARGGSAFSLYHLAKGLDRRRYEPTVLFYAPEQAHILRRIAEAGIPTLTLAQVDPSRDLPAGKPGQRRDIGGWLEAHTGHWSREAYTSAKAGHTFLRQDVARVAPIAQAIRKSRADLVHINHGLRSGKPELLAAWLMQKPSICHVRAFDTLSSFDRLFATFASAFIYISGAVQANYTAQGIRPGKAKVMYNALDLDDYSGGSDGTALRTAVRAEFGWPADTPLVGVVGRLDWWKGHEYFLEAVAEAAQSLPALRGLIVGEPEATPKNREYYQRLLGLTEALRLQERVVFTGFRSDIPQLMSALDVVVLSSSTPEPFGRVLLEGMAAGRPVVATAAGGVLEIIQDGVTGVLVPPKDPLALAQAIGRLLKDQEQAVRIGQAARRCVEEKFTIQQHVLQVQDLYDMLLS